MTTKKHDDDIKDKPADRQDDAQSVRQANLDNAVSDIDRMRLTDPLFIEKTRPEDPSGRPGQLTRDNVNPSIPSVKRDARTIDECGRVDPNAGGIVDPNSLGMPQGGKEPNYPPPREELRKQREAEAKEGETPELPEGVVSPRAGSINEPPGSTVLSHLDRELPPGVGGGGETAPTVTSIDPTSCSIGDPDFTVYVAGEGFTEDSVIVFAGNDEPTTLEDDGTLSTGVNMAMWHGPDTVQVSVRNGDKMSNTVDFTFNEGEADPDVLEDEIDAMKEDGDITSRKPKRKR